MTILPRWFRRSIILTNEAPKGPWGGSDDAGKPGPRNPWAVPPGVRKGAAKPTALDEFLKRARGGGGGGGLSGVPGGPNARALWAIGAAIIATIWVVFTSIHLIGPQQRGVVTYFGAYSHTMDPGIGFTPPAPIASVAKVDVRRIRTDNFPQGDGENLTLTGDQNIVDLGYSVRWDIADPKDYVFQLAEPQETVRATVESAMRAVLATTTLNEAIGAGRTRIEQRVADLTQSILNDYRSGVRIQGVAIKQATAPAQIVDAFNAVTAAQQGAVQNLNQAQSYAQQVLAQAQGEAASFDKVYEQYKLSPEVTRRRMYYETMEKVLAKSDKTIVEPQNVVPYLTPPPAARRLTEPTVSAAPQTGASQ